MRRGSSNDSSNELDEIEIQKGLIQIGKALQFLHESAKLVHSNLTPEAIVVNAKVSVEILFQNVAHS
jgi:SCY1-like protein 2